MKKIILCSILIVSFLTSCSKLQKSDSNGYITKLDTVYKDNSTNIDYITSTFYTIDDESRNLSVRRDLSDKSGSISLIIIDGNEIVVDRSTIKYLVETSNTILSHKNKNLTYSLSPLDKKLGLTLSNIRYDNGNIIITIYYSDNLKSITLSKSDIKNLENAYKKSL
jgi:hypothetical protein